MVYKTPASKRFVPPSSSTSSSARPTLSKKFLRPSQSQSSPYLKTPVSVGFKARPKDDIQDIDVEEDGVNSAEYSKGVSIQKARQPRYLASSHDIVEDDDDLAFDVDHLIDQPDGKRQKLTHWTNRPADEIEDYGDDTRNYSSSPLIRNSPPSNDVTESLALEAEQVPEQSNVPKLETNAGEEDDASLPSSSGSPTKNFETPRRRTGRFRNVMPPGMVQYDRDSMQQPLPSFQTRLLGKAGLKPPLKPQPLELDFVLPNAFSPSRKSLEEYKEYVYGGHAEAVRDWVLGTAAKAIVSPQKPRGSKDYQYLSSGNELEAKNCYEVTRILLHDSSDQFVVAEVAPVLATSHADPTERKVWLLLDHDLSAKPNGIFGGSSRFDSMGIGQRIKIKGGDALQWQLQSSSICTVLECVDHVQVASVWHIAN